MRDRDLTDEMRKDMEYEKRAWGLESGMFFDGHFYRNVYGDILTQGHPKRQEIYQEYIDSENKKIAEFNQKSKENEKYRRKFYQNN